MRGVGASARASRPLIALGLTVFMFCALCSAHAATIVIVNGNAAGTGLNDPTPVAPIGGNPGTTLGAQRLFALQFAANVWGAVLTSTVDIAIYATFSPLTCTPTAAVTGGAGPRNVYRDFPGAPLAGHWYVSALANKLSGTDLSTGSSTPIMNAEISGSFNVNLGQVNCLPGRSFYLGVDNNHGTNVDLVSLALREFAHGLGFHTSTNTNSGNYFSGFPNAFDHFLFDTTANLSWDQMTPAQRVASVVNTRKLVWSGAQVTAAVPSVLLAGTPELSVSGPASVAGTYLANPASFGPSLMASSVAGHLMNPIGDPLACNPLAGFDALAVAGNVAFIERGTCAFTTKVKNAQNAGAVAVVIADNIAGTPPGNLTGTDPTITIPSVRITQADGALLREELHHRARTRSGVIVALEVDLSARAGADPQSRMLMATPIPYQSGGSIGFWDPMATPDQVMEAGDTPTGPHSVQPPEDLTLPALRDLGW